MVPFEVKVMARKSGSVIYTKQSLALGGTWTFSKEFVPNGRGTYAKWSRSEIETSTVAWHDRIYFFSISWHTESRRILIHPHLIQKSQHFHVLPAFCKIIFVISSRSANWVFEVCPVGRWYDFTIFNDIKNHSRFNFVRKFILSANNWRWKNIEFNACQFWIHLKRD
jgi:hypothetical protein